MEPNTFVEFKCWDCGTQFDLSTAGLNDNERHAFTLILTSHPSKAFNDERVYAAHIWLSLRRSEVKKYERETSKKLDENKPYPLPTKKIWRPSESEKTKSDRDALKQRAFQFLENRRKYYKQLANGPDTFP